MIKKLDFYVDDFSLVIVMCSIFCNALYIHTIRKRDEIELNKTFKNLRSEKL